MREARSESPNGDAMSIISTAVGFVNPAAGMALKVLGGIKDFLAKLPAWVFIVAAALLFAFWCWHEKNHQASKDARTISGWQHKAEDSHHAFLLEKGQFAIEKASLDQARKIINENNRRILAEAADLDRAKQDAAAADARNIKLAQSTDAEISALQSAATKHTKPCTLSDEARHELEGR